MKTLTVRLPKELARRLDRLAADTRRPKGWYVRNALLAYLEDIEDAAYAEARYEEIASGQVKTIPLERIARTLTDEDRVPSEGSR
ncbi:MAG: ribbon-helix-helix protein, CopG family [Zetaproteobacteria bacterium]|nr:MAG: ribbon-helix-helix protein, CopG family [Zetaproteobacteria bacterium]